jgi:hypothetical protein
VESLHKALTKEQEAPAITRKANIALKQKYCDLDGKHKQLKKQYSILWDSNSHSSQAKHTSTPSTSQSCGKYYNLDLNAYSTNFANMVAMRKEIARFNEIIGKGCLSGKAQVSDKKANDSRVPQFKQGRHSSIKHGLRQTTGAKTNGRKIRNGYECVKFERKGKIGIDRPAQTAAVPHHTRSAVVKGGSAAPCKNGKFTNFVPDQTKPKKKVSQRKQIQQKSKEFV